MKYTQCTPDIRSNYLAELLTYRGITKLNEFIYPTKEEELNPLQLTNMCKAVELLKSHLDNKIALIVDCDCDGYTSSAILYQYLHDIKPDIQLDYFLHSGKEHGLQDMMEKIDDKYDLIILPDASSNDYEFHKKLAELGIAILILDHHEAEKLSDDACVVNNQLSTEYENKELTGAGVVYKFCEAYDKTFGYNFSDKYVDLAAIGIIGDMSSIINLETRYIINEGLKRIHNSFIQAIIEKQAYSIGSGGITPTAVSFYIVPLINALIRVGSDKEKDIMFNAFIRGDEMVQSTKRGAQPGQYESLATQAARTCVNARSRQNRAKEKALDILEMTIEKNSLNENKILIVPIEDDHIDTTLTGLIAMQLAAKYKKPVLVGRESTDGFLRGSGRGPDKTALKDFRQFLIDSGYFNYAEGHPLAFGHEISLKNLDAFVNYANKELEDVNFNEGIYNVDFVREGKDKDIPELVMDIGRAADLWGKGNEEPYIIIKDIYLSPNEVSVIGSNKDTVKFSACGVDFVKFKDPKMAEILSGAKTIQITILGRANINSFMGKETPQIFIEDYDLAISDFEF